MKKTVVITGVTQGLGEAMAKEFKAHDFAVIGCGRNPEKISALAKEFKEDHDFRVVDVTDFAQVSAWSREITKKFPVLDLLINNASIVNKNAPLEKVPADEFANVMRTNVNGTFNVIKAFLPFMKEKNHGLILNVSSGWGREAAAEVGPYCASKFAIEGLTGSLAKELPKGMAAMSFDPGGSVATEMLASCYPQDMESSPKPDVWAKTAVPYILQLGVKDNGKQLTCPKPNHDLTTDKPISFSL